MGARMRTLGVVVQGGGKRSDTTVVLVDRDTGEQFALPGVLGVSWTMAPKGSLFAKVKITLRGYDVRMDVDQDDRALHDAAGPVKKADL